MSLPAFDPEHHADWLAASRKHTPGIPDDVGDIHMITTVPGRTGPEAAALCGDGIGLATSWRLVNCDACRRCATA